MTWDERGRGPGSPSQARCLLPLLLLLLVLPGSSRAQGTIDINRASAQELTGLPGIGPKKARAIVADREQTGPFSSVDDLVRVKGIGPRTLEKLRPLISAGGAGGAPAGRGPAAPAGPSRPRRVNVNLATLKELVRLKGVGVTRARALIASRESEGFFRTLQDLTRVPGIGPSTVHRLAPRITLTLELNRATRAELETLFGSLGYEGAAAAVERARQAHPFARLEDILKVPGFGRATLEKLRGLVEVRPLKPPPPAAAAP